MNLDIHASDFPTFEDIKEAAEHHFVTEGYDPGEFQGFLTGCQWLLQWCLGTISLK